MAGRIKVGLFSTIDPKPWIREKSLDVMLKREAEIVKALNSKGVEVIRGGEGLSKENQLAWNDELTHQHIENIADKNLDALVINQLDWTLPLDSVDAVALFQKKIKDIPKVMLLCHKRPEAAGLVTGMAIAGALKRIGTSYQLFYYSKLDKEPQVIDEFMDALAFYKKRTEVAPIVRSVIEDLRGQKYLAFGGMSLRMSTATSDIDQWRKMFGISYEAIDQSEIKFRALKMIEWESEAGDSEYHIKDERVEKASNYLHKEGHGNFDFSHPTLPSLQKFIYQLSLYYAALDICEELGVTFCGIKCQDELTIRECSACLISSFLNNNVGPDSMRKKIIPTSCENDMDSALTQLWMHLLTGKPAGFGDFRDVVRNTLYIVNCGQHPPYFFGSPEEDSVKKLDLVEYMGQEEAHAPAGGSSVRGRTPAGQVMTIARLARENLRYFLVATVLQTVEALLEEHSKYGLSWPIIKGEVPISGDHLIRTWPSNHLAFSFGDLTPHLVEMAERLDIGYRVFDRKGREYFKPS